MCFWCKFHENEKRYGALWPVGAGVESVEKDRMNVAVEGYLSLELISKMKVP